jgi:hypothetical protein
MSWIHRAWPLALLVSSLLSACPVEDGEDGNSSANATADDAAALGCAAEIPFDTTAGASNPIMQTWGAACTSHADCVALIGDPDAICDTTAVVFELPGGYCTKACTLPDLETRSVPDAPDCAAEGGVTCLGVKGTFERCGIPCTDDMQCNRGGYECRQMPLISQPEDPSFCLMPDCCQDTCEE